MEAACILLCIVGRPPEVIHTRAAHTDRLLFSRHRFGIHRRAPARPLRRCRNCGVTSLWRAISERAREDRQGPAHSARSMSTSKGSSIFVSWSTRIPMIAVPRLGRVRNRPHRHVHGLAVPAKRQAHAIAGKSAGRSPGGAAQVSGRARRRQRRSRRPRRGCSRRGHPRRRWSRDAPGVATTS